MLNWWKNLDDVQSDWQGGMMGKLVFDGLKLVQEAERMGASPEAAKRAEEIVRRMVYEAFDEGMAVEEIRAEFARISRELDEMASGLEGRARRD